MLKRLWRYIWGEPDPDTALEMLRIIVENQEKVHTSVMGAVAATVAASEKQAEVLAGYLKLFQTPGDPQAWKEPTPEEEGERSMKALGFDPDGKWSEAEMAEWVLKNIDKL